MKTQKWTVVCLLISVLVWSGCSNERVRAEAAEVEGQVDVLLENAGWMTDYEAALVRAESEGKPILMNFTGSDWCPPCKLMQKEVFSTEEFARYAEDHLILLELDYPMNVEQPKEVVEQNKELQKEFDIEVFPTFVILQPNGKEEKRTTAYREGGPSAFIAWIGG